MAAADAFGTVMWHTGSMAVSPAACPAPAVNGAVSRIVRIDVFQVDLPYAGGTYRLSGGREYRSFAATIVRDRPEDAPQFLELAVASDEG